MSQSTSPEYYGQLKQDLECLEYFKNKKDGFFVDIGAGNGKDLSNTYLLEKNFGWKGICVEPLKDPFTLCKKLRTNSQCYETCVYDRCGQVEFSYIPGSSGESYMYSGISEEIKHHQSRVNSDSHKVFLPATTLTNLLDESNAPKIIDFLSIDTEGSEAKILGALDHSKYKFRYITVEHNYVPQQREEIKSVLEKHGYKFLKENQWDDVYICDN